jgi:hypothetical protein
VHGLHGPGNAPGRGLLLGRPVFRHRVLGKEEAAAVDDQGGQFFPFADVGDLKRLSGQTAQLVGFSAAGLGLAVDVVGVKEEKLACDHLVGRSQDQEQYQGRRQVTKFSFSVFHGLDVLAVEG